MLRHKFLGRNRGIDFYGNKKLRFSTSYHIFFYGSDVYAYVDLPRAKKIDLDNISIKPICSMATWVSDDTIIQLEAFANTPDKDPEPRPAYYISNEENCPDVKWITEKE